MAQYAFIGTPAGMAPALAKPRKPSGRAQRRRPASAASPCRALALPHPRARQAAPATLPCARPAAVAATPQRSTFLALSLTLVILAGTACPTRMQIAAPVLAPEFALETPAAEELPPAESDAPPVPTADAAPALPADAAPAQSLVPEEVRRAISKATRTVGVDTGYLTVVAARESGFDPAKHAQRTTATGLYQFTDNTWLRVVKLFGAKYGLGDYAQQIVLDQNGGVSMPHPRARAALLQMRNDPQLSALMAAELALDNKGRLERILGRIVTPAETYLAHFFGVVPAARIIDAARATPRIPAAALLPTAAQSNPKLFHPSGEVASAHGLISAIEANFARQTLHFAGA